ncbi:MAG: hypothetical protein HY898_32400 [Deltaproteobacteria bacterium]|nr:hypothetical protein [Deltaproteobacteria bacterium]
MNTRTLTIVAVAAVASLTACKSIAPPFDRLKDSPITVYRLQNYEPPAVATATPVPGATAGAPMIPGLPPEIQNWVTQGAAGMGSLIPPGLLPPGLIPGTAPGAAPPVAAPPPDAPRFEGFRILGQAQAMDQKLKEDLATLFGTESNFDSAMAQCLYPEVGVSFQQPPPMLPDNVLVSFSCNHVEAKNFQWPHPNKGLKQETIKKFSEINKKLFGG